MSTGKLIRRELKREIRLTFQLSKRNYKEIFLRVVEEWASQYQIPLHGRKTAVFLLVFRQALQQHQRVEEEAGWHEREVQFVTMTREQEETIAGLKRELGIERLNHAQTQRDNDRLRSVIQCAAGIMNSLKT
jgi:hypothetical protein